MDQPRLSIGTTEIPVEVVSSPADINKGLARRRSLEASHGMLFLFDHNAQFKFWMRGMRFPIDILWIGEDLRIVDMTENTPIVPFLKRAFARPVFYSPSTPARYVLEVNAYFCKTHGIKIGDAVEFRSIAL